MEEVFLPVEWARAFSNVPAVVLSDNAMRGSRRNEVSGPKRRVSNVEIPNILNEEDLLDRCDGDLEFVSEIVEDFMEIHPDLLSDIEDGIRSQNAHQVVEAAHSLKGLVGHFAVDQFIQLVGEVERAAREENLEEASTHLEQVGPNIETLKESLQKFVTKETA